MKKLTLLGMILGLMLLAGLIVWQGLVEIIQLLLTSGWQLLLLPLVWLPSLIPTTESWRLCFMDKYKPSLKDALIGTLVARGVNNFLPVASIGGEVVKARLITLNGCPLTDATASVMVDKALHL